MDFCTVFGVMLLFIEVSTPFVSLRWLIFTHGKHYCREHGHDAVPEQQLARGEKVECTCSASKWYGINALLAFVAFLFGRILYQFYIVFWVGMDYIYVEYNQKELTLYKGIVLTEMAIMVIMSVILNSYWFLLMCKMIMRVLKRKLTAPKNEDEVELVKADSMAIVDQENFNDGTSTQGSNTPKIEEQN